MLQPASTGKHPYHDLMLKAVALSRNGFGTSAPNPCVGALLVKNGRIVGAGWHQAAGQPHAEVMAMRDAIKRGIHPGRCTLVVTLEPCNHQGKTPPCTKSILAAGIKHVVIGARDPNPQAAGGAEALAAQGVKVECGVAEQECLDNIADFLTWQNSDRPYVILKLAATMDGRIAASNGQSKWISGPETLGRVHWLRSRVQAVLVGGGTFHTDNPELTCREEVLAQDRPPSIDGLPSPLTPEGTPWPHLQLPPEPCCAKQPLAVVVSSRLPGIPQSFKLLQQRPEDVIFWTSSAVAASPKAEALRRMGASVTGLDPLKGESRSLPGRGGSLRNSLDIAQGLATLRRDHGVHHLICEGGGRLGLWLLENGLADEFRLHLAPKIMGDNDASPLFDGRMPASMEDALGLRIAHTEICGQDLLLTLRRKNEVNA